MVYWMSTDPKKQLTYGLPAIGNLWWVKPTTTPTVKQPLKPKTQQWEAQTTSLATVWWYWWGIAWLNKPVVWTGFWTTAPNTMISAMPDTAKQGIIADVNKNRQASVWVETQPTNIPVQQEPMAWKMDLVWFWDKIKAKYPAYADMDSQELWEKMLAKYPQYQDMVWIEPMWSEIQAWWMRWWISRVWDDRWNREWLNPVWKIWEIIDNAVQMIPSITWDRLEKKLQERIAQVTPEERAEYESKFKNSKFIQWLYWDVDTYIAETKKTFRDQLMWIWDKWPNVAKIIANVPWSTVKTVTAIARAVTNPLDTLTWLKNILLTPEWRKLIGERYWSNFVQTLEQDPVWLASDVLALVEWWAWLTKLWATWVARAATKLWAEETALQAAKVWQKAWEIGKIAWEASMLWTNKIIPAIEKVWGKLWRVWETATKIALAPTQPLKTAKDLWIAALDKSKEILTKEREWVDNIDRLIAVTNDLDPATVSTFRNNPELMKAIDEWTITKEWLKQELMDIAEEADQARWEAWSAYKELYKSEHVFSPKQILADIDKWLESQWAIFDDKWNIIDFDKTNANIANTTASELNLIKSEYNSTKNTLQRKIQAWEYLTVAETHALKRSISNARFTEWVITKKSPLLKTIWEWVNQLLKKEVPWWEATDKLFTERSQKVKELSDLIFNRKWEFKWTLKALLWEAQYKRLEELEKIYPWLTKKLEWIKAYDDYLRTRETQKTWAYAKVLRWAAWAGTLWSAWYAIAWPVWAFVWWLIWAIVSNKISDPALMKSILLKWIETSWLEWKLWKWVALTEVELNMLKDNIKNILTDNTQIKELQAKLWQKLEQPALPKPWESKSNLWTRENPIVAKWPVREDLTKGLTKRKTIWYSDAPEAWDMTKLWKITKVQHTWWRSPKYQVQVWWDKWLNVDEIWWAYKMWLEKKLVPETKVEVMPREEKPVVKPLEPKLLDVRDLWPRTLAYFQMWLDDLGITRAEFNKLPEELQQEILKVSKQWARWDMWKLADKIDDIKLRIKPLINKSRNESNLQDLNEFKNQLEWDINKPWAKELLKETNDLIKWLTKKPTPLAEKQWELKAMVKAPEYKSAIEAMQSPEYKARMVEINKNKWLAKVTKTSNNLYHTTSAENIESIIKEWLTPWKKQRFEWVGSKDKISFWANEKTAKYYGKEWDVMLRTKASYKPKTLDADLLAWWEWAYTVSEKIPPEMLEVKIWNKRIPLKEYNTKWLKPKTMNESKWWLVAKVEAPRPEQINNIVLHNISLNKLQKTVELWWMPAPSIAITKQWIPFESYWDITFIWDKNLIKPWWKVMVWKTDIYTPTVPKESWIIKKWSWDKIEEIANKVWMNKERLYSRMQQRDDKLYYLWEHPELKPYVKDIESLMDRKLFKKFDYYWNKKYVDYNAENVVKDMFPRWWDPKTARWWWMLKWSFNWAMAAKSDLVKSIKEIKWLKFAEELPELTAKYDSLETKYNNKLWEMLWDKFRDLSKEFTDNIKRPNESIKSELAKYWAELDVKDIQDIKDLVDEWLQLPKSYIEAKIKRVVQPSEFQYVLVPEEQLTDVKNLLRWTKIEDKIVTYKKWELRSDKIKDLHSKYGNIFFNIAWVIVPAAMLVWWSMWLQQKQ